MIREAWQSVHDRVFYAVRICIGAVILFTQVSIFQRRSSKFDSASNLIVLFSVRVFMRPLSAGSVREDRSGETVRLCAARRHLFHVEEVGLKWSRANSSIFKVQNRNFLFSGVTIFHRQS